MDRDIKRFLVALAEFLDVHDAEFKSESGGIKVSIGSNNFDTDLTLSADAARYLVETYGS